MLHDPRHDRTPTLAGFALFVASRDPGVRYNWVCQGDCAVGQYLESIGRKWNDHGVWRGEMETANVLALGAQDRDVPGNWTFGRLADRILAYQIKNERILTARA